LRYKARPVKLFGAVLGLVVFLVSCGLTRACGRSAAPAVLKKEEIPSCAGILSPALPPTSSHTGAKPHSVTLSWNAAVPKSPDYVDAINGYYVYRSLTSHTYVEGNRLNSSPIAGTQCVDGAVDPGGVYFYAVKALSQGGAESDFSTEVKAVVPSP